MSSTHAIRQKKEGEIKVRQVRNGEAKASIFRDGMVVSAEKPGNQQQTPGSDIYVWQGCSINRTNLKRQCHLKLSQIIGWKPKKTQAAVK